MFVIRQSIGVSDRAETAHTERVALASQLNPVWELDGSFKRVC